MRVVGQENNYGAPDSVAMSFENPDFGRKAEAHGHAAVAPEALEVLRRERRGAPAAPAAPSVETTVFGFSLGLVLELNEWITAHESINKALASQCDLPIDKVRVTHVREDKDQKKKATREVNLFNHRNNKIHHNPNPNPNANSRSQSSTSRCSRVPRPGPRSSSGPSQS